VPTSDERVALPKWYPERPWSATEGVSRIYLEGKIVFDTDKATIRPGPSERVLVTLLAFANEHPEVTLIRVEGHTDTVGAPDMNKALSEQRANSVADYLVTKFGIDRSRLTPVGMGEEGLLVATGPGVSNAANRQVRVVTLTQ